MPNHRKHAHAVIDIETNAVLSRHRYRANALAAQAKWGPPTRIKWSARRVGETPRGPVAAERSAATEADAFTDRALSILSRH